MHVFSVWTYTLTCSCPNIWSLLRQKLMPQLNQRLTFQPPSPGNGGKRCWQRLFLCPVIFYRRFLFRFSFCFKGWGWTWRLWGSSFRPFCRWVLVGRWTAVLVQTHRAQRVDGKTNLLSETHQQPVDLTPKLPATVFDKNISSFLYGVNDLFQLQRYLQIIFSWCKGTCKNHCSNVRQQSQCKQVLNT